MSLWGTQDFFFEVAKETKDDHKPVILGGHNFDLDSSQEEDAWNVNGNLQHLSTASSIELTGNSNDVYGTGTGAWVVSVDGLDENYEPINEIVQLSGATAATTTAQFLRVIKMTVGASGSVGTNSGEILAKASSDDTIQCQMDAGAGMSSMGHYTVPAENKGYVVKLEFSAHKDGAVDPIVSFKGYIRPVGGAWLRILEKTIDTSKGEHLPVDQPIMSAIPSKADMKIMCKTDTDDTKISVRAYIIDVNE